MEYKLGGGGAEKLVAMVCFIKWTRRMNTEEKNECLIIDWWSVLAINRDQAAVYSHLRNFSSAENFG